MSVIEAKTNEKGQSCVDAACGCGTMWSLAQQFSVERLSGRTGEFKGKLIQDFEVRAKRIAATYARFYLEMESGGDLTKKGRFYWMALGAFASKTVACTLALTRVKMLPWVTDGLGKGNFWLFCDISGWHWYYANHSRSFDACKESRSALTYDEKVKKLVQKLPWHAESLPVIKQLGISAHIRNGFAKVREFEATSDRRRASKIQYEHLIAIANHEQGEVLQPLIYDNRVFSGSVAAQRAPVLNWFSPDVELVFSHACQTEEKTLKSVPPEGTKIEDFTSRMAWITKAADQFHLLMQENRAFMEGELRTMAGWVDMPDR
jgi:hypothetical protein